MREPYRSELMSQWNAWLKAGYGSTVQLADALSARYDGPRAELLKDVNTGDSPHGPGWNVLTIDRSDTTAISTVKDPSGSTFVKWNATRPGLPGWQYSLLQFGLDCKEGKRYTVTFDARIDASDPSTQIPLAVNAQADGGDFHLIGLTANFTLTREWKTYTYTLTAADVIPGHTQFSLNLGKPGIMDIRNAGMMLENYNLPAGTSLEAGNFPLPVPGQADWDVWRADFFRFLADTQNATVRDLKGTLRDLRVRSLVFNAQADYGGYYGFTRESGLSDLIDLHFYWDFPSWQDVENPGQTGWTIPNESQVLHRGDGSLTRAALFRNAGMPFTVSEYNTSAPSDYASEMDPMMSTFASFQDWDAVYSFVYCDAGDNLPTTPPGARGDLYRNSDKIRDFFTNGSHRGKRVFMPSAALVFRLGLVRPGSSPVTLELSRALTSARFDNSSMQYYWNRAVGGGANNAAAARRMQVKPMDTAGTAASSLSVDFSATSPSDTGEIVWDQTGQAYTVNAPAVRIALGAISGRQIRLGDVAITVGTMKQPHATVEIVAMDGRPIAGSKKLLISVAARVENEGWTWDAGRHYITNWESIQSAAGTRTIAEPVPIAIDLPGQDWKVRMLDGSGYPTGAVPTVQVPEGTRMQVDSPRTLWYLAER